MARTQQQAPLTTPPMSPRLSIYHWRLTMLASITHRASGVLLVFTIPVALWLLLTMSHTQAGFAYGMTALHSPIGTALLWLTTTSLAYHCFNGIRFLCLDIGITDSRNAMKASAKIVFILTFILATSLVVIL